jgi:hypothetical protein
MLWRRVHKVHVDWRNSTPTWLPSWLDIESKVVVVLPLLRAYLGLQALDSGA